jgi:class 3 adenylate cyclase
MPRLQRKSFTAPDQVRTFARGRVEIILLDEIEIGGFALQPGWRWSKDVAPIVRTRSCQDRHLGYATSGSLEVAMDDGTKLVIAVGDCYEIPPGHEVEVIGDEPWESLEFASAHTFGLAPEELGERVLATVLFSDIVGSTAVLERVGDHAWAGVLREHNARLRAAIDRFRGREVVSTGDGFLALFDGAAKAVRAGQPRGVGVHAAARVAALAGPGEVLVSGTTRDLLDGSGLVLDPRGDYELKGLSGTRTIFALRR